MEERNTRLSDQTTDLKEYRRFRAWELYREKGWTQQQIADVLGVTRKAQIPGLLKQGAEAYGFRGEAWTRERVSQVIRREFGVTYTPRHVGRILQDLGWSPQKPISRASQRDEEVIQRWTQERWPELQKKPKRTDTP